MAKQKFTEPADDGRILTLLTQIPVDVFVRMVSKSGLTIKDSRELCQAFKGLKG